MARILIIDDDDILAELMADRLEAVGHEVRALPDGERAIEAIGDFRPELVVLDHHMPGTSGMAVLARIRAEASLAGLPVMMLTADREPALLARAHEGGADDYLRKPVALDMLAEHVASMLKGGRIAREAGAAD